MTSCAADGRVDASALHKRANRRGAWRDGCARRGGLRKELLRSQSGCAAHRKAHGHFRGCYVQQRLRRCLSALQRIGRRQAPRAQACGRTPYPRADAVGGNPSNGQQQRGVSTLADQRGQCRIGMRAQRGRSSSMRVAVLWMRCKQRASGRAGARLRRSRGRGTHARPRGSAANDPGRGGCVGAGPRDSSSGALLKSHGGAGTGLRKAQHDAGPSRYALLVPGSIDARASTRNRSAAQAIADDELLRPRLSSLVRVCVSKSKTKPHAETPTAPDTSLPAPAPVMRRQVYALLPPEVPSATKGASGSSSCGSSGSRRVATT